MAATAVVCFNKYIYIHACRYNIAFKIKVNLLIFFVFSFIYEEH